MMSATAITNFTQAWQETMQHWHFQLFCIPTIIITMATFFMNPVLLVCIFMSRALRAETRYLLLANTLTADIVFAVLTLVALISNAAGAPLPWVVCELLTAVRLTCYTCTMITVTLMVIETFAAVRWPLQYHNLLSPTATYSILLLVWIFSAIYPFVLMVMTNEERGSAHGKLPVCLTVISLGFLSNQKTGIIYLYFFMGALLCSVLVSYCYIRLYMVTRKQGIWHSRYSRARVTLLAHGVLLLLYFAPGFVFTVELYVFLKKHISLEVRVWISTVNTHVLMLLPRAFAPFLYGLRYREIADSVTLLLHCQRRNNRLPENS